jgi:hypothetical protein
MNSITTNQNNVNKAYPGHKNSLLNQSTVISEGNATGKPPIEDQNGGLSSYLEYNAQTQGDLKSSLGISTISCNPEKDEINAKREKRYINQEVARSLIGGRLELCGRVPVPLSLNGNLIHIPDGQRKVSITKNGENYSFAGLMRCGSVWNCPECASMITEYRRNELKLACENASSQGLYISMLTLTVPHYAKDQLQNVLDGISGALRKFKNRKAFKKVALEIGLVGNIRTLEATYGENGWHPHFHILLFTKSEITGHELVLIQQSLLSQWQSACVSSGLPLPNNHGLDLVNGAHAAAYVTKWGIEEEMTKGHLKQGIKEGHVSPFGLLDLYREGDKNAGRRFQEFTKVSKGKRQLVWSKGLRELLEVGKQKPDEEIIADMEKISVEVMTISYPDFQQILKHKKRAEFLSKICPQGKEAIRAFIDDLYHRDVSFNPLDYS